VLDASDTLAKALGVAGTPCAFVNCYRVEGALPREKFVAVINAQLAKAPIATS
jgi:protein-disulfide isomerase